MIRLFSLLVGCCVGSAVLAADPAYPSKPIHLVVPYSPGGAVDTTGRLLADSFTRTLGQTALVDYRAGAGGTIGASYVAKAQPDGYTLLVGGNGPLTVAPHLMSELNYEPLTDLEPVSLLVVAPLVLVVPESRPWRSVDDLVAHAKRQPGVIRAASAGNGTSQHLALESFKSEANVEMIHAPYRGTSTALNDVLAGHVDMMFSDFSAVPHINGGKLRALAVLAPERSALLPEVPTIGELGLPVNVYTYHMLLAPQGTPDAVKNKLNQAVRTALADPKVREPLESVGMFVRPTSPEEAAQFLKNDSAEVGRLLNNSGK